MSARLSAFPRKPQAMSIMGQFMRPASSRFAVACFGTRVDSEVLEALGAMRIDAHRFGDHLA